MKKLLSVLFFSFLTIGLIPIKAQKIEEDKVNALNKRVMYTNWLMINWGSDTHKLEVCMLLEGVETSLILNWQCTEIVGVERNSEVILTFDDGSQSVLYNKSFSVSGAGKIHTSEVSKSTMGIQINAKGDFHSILDKKLTNIQITTTNGTTDFPITSKEAETLTKMYEVFEKQQYKKEEDK